MVQWLHTLWGGDDELGALLCQALFWATILETLARLSDYFVHLNNGVVS